MINLLESKRGAVAHSHVQWVDSAREVAPELWQRCWPAKTEALWWYQLLEDSGLEEQFTFKYGIISRGSVPIGIIPAFVMDVPLDLVMPPAVVAVFNVFKPLFPKVGFQRTLFIGSPCADEGSLGLLPEIGLSEVAHTIESSVESLAAKLNAPMIVWKDFAENTIAQLGPLAQDLALFPMASYPGTIVDLPQGGFSEYLSQLSSARRHNLKKKLKRSHAAAPLKIEVLKFPGEEVLREVFGLFMQTYEKATTKFEKLDVKFFRAAAALEQSNFVVLRHEGTGEMVAFMLCFDLGSGYIINKFIGIDYHRPKDWFLYFRLWEAAVSWAIGVGATCLQSGQTGYRPKIDVGHSLIPLFNLCKHRNPVMHWIYALVAKDISFDSLDKDLAVFFEAHPELSLSVPSLQDGQFRFSTRSVNSAANSESGQS